MKENSSAGGQPWTSFGLLIEVANCVSGAWLQYVPSALTGVPHQFCFINGP